MSINWSFKIDVAVDMHYCFIMEAINEYLYWDLGDSPAGADAWPRSVGRLESASGWRRVTVTDFFSLHIVTRGSGNVHTDHERSRLCPGDMFMVWPNVKIEYFDDPERPWEFHWLDLAGAKASRYAESFGFDKRNITLTPTAPVEAIKAFKKVVHHFTERRSPFAMLSDFYRLPMFGRAATTSGNQDPFAMALAIIDGRLSEGINVNELCDQLNLSRTTLFRMFKARAGASPIEFITQKRIAKAQALLKYTAHNLPTIAHACGYASENYFHRKFKQALNTTPTDYRAKENSR